MYTSLADAYFFRGQPRQSHTHGQLGSTSSSMALDGSIAGIIWMVLLEPATGTDVVGWPAVDVVGVADDVAVGVAVVIAAGLACMTGAGVEGLEETVDASVDGATTGFVANLDESDVWVAVLLVTEVVWDPTED